MRKADVKAGGIYARKYGGDVLLLSTDIVRYEPRERLYALAGPGQKPQKPSWSGTRYGYLVARGRDSELPNLDAAQVFQAILSGTRENVALPSGVYLDVLYSLTPLLGEAQAVAEQRERERQGRWDRDREKTTEYNNAAKTLNYLLDTKLSLHPANFTWGHHIPKIELSLAQVAEIAANAQRLETEAHGRGLDQALQSFADREAAGEIYVYPQEYSDEE
jgi:hypothetical protein